MSNLKNQQKISTNALLANLWLIAVLLYFSLQFLNWPWLNVFFFAIWLISVATFGGQILQKIFQIKKGLSHFLGYFLGIYLLGFVANIFTAWLALNNLTILASLIIVSVILFVFSKKFANQQLAINNQQSNSLFRPKPLFWLTFVILIIIGFIFIVSATTGDYIQSPWQVISPWYMLIVFVATLMIFFAVFSKKRTTSILMGIVLLSLLIHSYLLVYDTGFGGDRWRHIGSEYRIMQEMEYQPTLLTNNLWYQKVMGVKVPRALVDGPKLSYGFEWSISVIVSKVTGIDVFHLDKYLLWLLWSLFMPIIFFVGAKQIKANKQLALLAAATPLVFYVFQYYGAQTLPIGYGAVFIAFVVALCLALIKNKLRITDYGLLITIIILSYFSYSLSFILAVIIGLLVWILKWKKPWLYFGLAVLSIFIFLAEMFSGFSKMARPSFRRLAVHLVKESNLLFFNLGKSQLFNWSWFQYVAGLITVIFTILFLLFLWQALRSKNSRMYFIGWGFIVLMVNYLMAWNLLSGLYILSRRLDVFILIFVAIIFAWGLWRNFSKTKKTAGLVAWGLTILLLVSYMSGPVQIAMVTTDETQAMKYVWGEIKDNPNDYCVLANTWPLLALEGYSAKQVVAGNFPSDFNHQQPERVALYEKIIKPDDLPVEGGSRFGSPNRGKWQSLRLTLDSALKVSDKKKCFLAVDKKIAGPLGIKNLGVVIGEPIIFGDIYVWEF